MKVTINGIYPYDGEYELDEMDLTNREIHIIKTTTGVLPLNYVEALEAGDNDFVVAFAAIALRRTKRFEPKVDLDLLWDAKVGAIHVDMGDAEEDEEHPTTGGPSERSTRSGSPSPSDSESPELHPNGTGHPSSDTPESASEISAS